GILAESGDLSEQAQPKPVGFACQFLQQRLLQSKRITTMVHHQIDERILGENLIRRFQIRLQERLNTRFWNRRTQFERFRKRRERKSTLLAWRSRRQISLVNQEFQWFR